MSQNALVLVSQTGWRRRNLAGKPPQFGKYTGIDFDPLPRDLEERYREVMVEDVFATPDHFVAAPEDAFEIFRRHESGERFDGRHLDAALDQSGDGGVDLIPAQLDGPRRQRAGTGIGREDVRPRAPGEKAVSVFAERSGKEGPIDPLGGALKGWNPYGLEIEPRPLHGLVPNLRHLPV